MRERGLKHLSTFLTFLLKLVAPHAGAWIETLLLLLGFLFPAVAPHAGAWIETCVAGSDVY